MAVGFVSDAFDWVGDRLSDAGDVAIDVLEKIPMAPELADALSSVVNGPLRDFARTDLGMSVLRAMSTTLYGPLAWTIGPQVAALAFAVPGVARGEDFWTAWLRELSWRAEKTAEYVAPMASEAITPKIKEAAGKLVAMIPYEDLRGMASDELARRLNVDEWTAAMAASLVGLIPIPSSTDFDPTTGRRVAVNGNPVGVATLGLRKRPGTSAPSSGPSRNACQAAEAAEAGGQSFAIVRALRAKCYAAQDAGEIDAQGYTIPPNMRAGATTIAASSPRNGTGSNVALVAVGGAAALALVWWYRSR